MRLGSRLFHRNSATCFTGWPPVASSTVVAHLKAAGQCYDGRMASLSRNTRREHDEPMRDNTRQVGLPAPIGGHFPTENGPTITVSYGDPWETEPCALLPPGDFHAACETPTDRRALRSRFGFPDESTGRNSSTVRSLFMSCTAGWPIPPTSEEFYLALRADEPSSRQKAVIRTWLAEAAYGEIMLAWVEEAFSWRELVAAVHRIGYRRNDLNRYLNQFAKSERERSPECPSRPSN